MRERPDGPTLLDAVSQFLMVEVLPKIEDKALAFRVMIAANLSTVVSAELKSEDGRYGAEAKRLLALLPGVVDAAATLGPVRKDRLAALGTLNRTLAERLRSGALDEAGLRAAQAHVKQTLLDTLAAVNPRFDTSDEIE